MPKVGLMKSLQMQILSMNAPKRVEKILGEIDGTGNFEYLFQQTTGSED